MTALKCLIVDDEPLAIDLVANFLGRLDIKNITRCENGVEAFRRLQETSYDLLFLDIEMPVLGGLDLLKSLSHRPAVVITTAYRDYAVEGFELEVLDYLVKPFSFTRFLQTMKKLGRAGSATGHQPAHDQSPVAESSISGPAVAQPDDIGKDCLFVKVGRELVKVNIRDIRYIESRKDYIWLNTIQKDLLCHQSLTDITAKLPAEKFFRVHRSYTVALDKVDSFRNNNLYIQGKRIPVSRENRQELRQRLSPVD
jgi:DNA-binding LytR/AlgR family response regulator